MQRQGRKTQPIWDECADMETDLLDEGAVGVELLRHDVVIHLAADACAEDAVECALVVVVQLHAHVVPRLQQIRAVVAWPEVHQPCARILCFLQEPNTSSNVGT